jgi:hypothetical protein
MAVAWTRWTKVAHVVGNVQARILLTLFYFVIAPPFALVVKLLHDPLALREPREPGGARGAGGARGPSYWRERPAADPAERAGGRQF